MLRRNLTPKFDSLPPAVKEAIQAWVPLKNGRPPHHPERMACLAVMQAIARAWGGECLSRLYLNMQRPLTFRCKEGHVWQGTPANLLYGTFCPQCYNHGRETLQGVKAFARSRGLTCLSKHYIKNSQPLRWRCGKGHEWTTPLCNLRSGTGCPECYRERVYHTLQEMQDIAKARGGVCLSEHYGNVDHKLTWQCHRGHIWDAPPARILTGAWCRQCAQLERIGKSNPTAKLKYLPAKK
ncbi:hypothetical protein [Paludibacterium purpuratum]|uniref:Treble clef zinc finger domain-containing protein n=1 Tax=Paludibacterium purpuratum TaxID=1144873 RepID=A0A4R7AYG8_9NEIS|nr:hypothetical protein [Paludibacterium purpuratum]TDR72971.1 hypothetical protein DFP86_1152 [Paludibacterium purpuratum]